MRFTNDIFVTCIIYVWASRNIPKHTSWLVLYIYECHELYICILCDLYYTYMSISNHSHAYFVTRIIHIWVSRTRHVWLVLYIYEHHEPWLVLIHKWVYRNIRLRTMTKVCWLFENRPTQSIIYVPFQVNTFQKSILLIVQYKYLKSCSEDFILQNLILCTRSCGTGFFTQSSWVFHFHPTIMVGWKCFVPQSYQLRRGILEGPALKHFYMIHRGGWSVRTIHVWLNLYIYEHHEPWLVSYINEYTEIYVYVRWQKFADFLRICTNYVWLVLYIYEHHEPWLAWYINDHTLIHNHTSYVSVTNYTYRITNYTYRITNYTYRMIHKWSYRNIYIRTMTKVHGLFENL